MEQVRLRYHRTSNVKKLAFSKSDNWDSVKAKIATAYGVTTSIQDAYIILSDAELDIGSMFPTLGSYLSVNPSGIGCAVFGLSPRLDVKRKCHHHKVTKHGIILL